MPFFTESTIVGSFDKPADIHRHPLTGISVLIVGAGPVGLYTALECWRKGHSVIQVLERSSCLSSAGDSFTVIGHHIEKTWPALFRALVEDSSDLWVSYHKITGKRLAGPEYIDVRAKADGRRGDDGGPGPSKVYRASRPKFTASLLAQVQELGIQVSFNKSVVEYCEDSAKGGVMLEDRTKVTADIVVAADGVGTKSHKLVNGSELPAMDTPWSIFRTAYPVHLVTSDAELAERFQLLSETQGIFELWSGNDLSFGIQRGLKRMEWVITHKNLDATTPLESWGNFVTGEQVAEYLCEFPDVPDYIKKLVKTAPNNSVIDWRLRWRDPQPRWSSPLGRVVQAGDSAHTFIPASGSGVNQGIEDSITLATCLQLGGNMSSNTWARAYNKLRFERVSCAQFLGFVNQSHYINPNWGKEAFADPESFRPEYGWWILGHNAEHYAYKTYGNVMRHLTEGTAFRNTNIPSGYAYKPWTLKELTEKLDRGEKLVLEGDWS